jgi:predicted component of type VI protein secretion system
MSATRTITSALDHGRFDAIAEYANLASSYWRSIEEAALRGDRLTIEVHCKQVSAVTREAFGVAKTLGVGSDKARQVA